MAALVTDLTPELIEEGFAREFVRRLQDLRKTADLDIADRIKVIYLASPKLAAAIQTYSTYIMSETLTVEMKVGENPGTLPQVEDDFDGEHVVITLEKI